MQIPTINTKGHKMTLKEIVAPLYVLLLICFLIQSVQHHSTKKQLEQKTSSLASEIIAKNIELHKRDIRILELSEEVEYYQKITNIKEYLRGYSVEEQALGLALCFTESSWNYNANHQGPYSNICGNKPHWTPYLNELGIEANSIEAGIAIYKFYKNKNNGSRFLAIKEYKGIKSQKNHYLVHSTLELREIILKELKK